TVVAEVTNPNLELSLSEVQEEIPDVEPGEELTVDVTPTDFGRIAAQSAKQVITQRIREAEREMVYDKYKNRVGELVIGTVQRHEKGNVVVDMGGAEACLPRCNMAFGERFRYGERIRAIISEVRDVRKQQGKEPVPTGRHDRRDRDQVPKDALLILSRRSPQLVIKLFEQEVAEMREGTVSIRLIAREPGKRSKIAVLSSDNNVDPVGACVGMKGSRVQMVVQELRGERIDIVEYSDDKRRFVANSLKPAEIESVELSEDGRRALLVVKDEELSLAIGKGGLNAMLASRLTGTEIDIMSVSQLGEREAEAKKELLELPSVQDAESEILMGKGLLSAIDIVEYGLDDLRALEGMSEETAEKIYREALRQIGELEPEPEESEEEGEMETESNEDLAEEEIEDTRQEDEMDQMDETEEEDADDEDIETAEEIDENVEHQPGPIGTA
ncbi:MAG TPA: transcription termination factor NusA, partial [bacterium]|nr:transcription termination factor NusA [bacterium]